MGCRPILGHSRMQKRSVTLTVIFMVKLREGLVYGFDTGADHRCGFSTGKPFYHEWVDLVRFNSEGKIAQLKEFLDTKALHGHLDEHESSQSKEKKKPT